MGKAFSNIVHAPERAAEWLHHATGMDSLMGNTPEERSKSIDHVVGQVQKTGKVDNLTNMGISSSLPVDEASEARRRIEAAKWSHQMRENLQDKGDQK